MDRDFLRHLNVFDMTENDLLKLNFGKEDLYCFNIIQLKEIGKKLYVKGATNNNKADLVDLILDKINNRYKPTSEYVDRKPSFGVSVLREPSMPFGISTAVDTTGAIVQDGLVGFCIIDRPHEIFDIYDTDFRLQRATLSPALIYQYELQDGDMIEYSIARFSDREAVCKISKINEKVDIALTKPKVEFVVSDDPIHYIVKNANNENSVAAFPFLSIFELEVLLNHNISVLSEHFVVANIHHQDIFCKIFIKKLLYYCKTQAKQITLYLDIDRFFIFFSQLQNKKAASLILLNFFQSACVYKNGGGLSVIGVSTSEELKKSMSFLF